MSDLVLKYSVLLGRYVDMRRPADEVEILDAKASGYELTEVGGAGIVAHVADGGMRVSEPSVLITFDYGMGYLITAEDEAQWNFNVFADEPTAKLFMPRLRRPPR